MQIRTLFLVCMSGVAALATGLGGWMLTRMVIEYSLAERMERAVDIDALLFAAADKIAVERPVVGDALLGDAPADAAMTDRLATIRADADIALVRVERRIADHSYPGAAEQLAVLAKTHSDLAAWRAMVDASLRQPRSQREQDTFRRYVAGLNRIFDATSSALDVGDMVASADDDKSAELMALARHVWAVRQTMGVRTVPLMAAIDADRMLESEQLEAQARFDGVLAANWTPIAQLSQRLSALPTLGATIVTGHAAFDAYDRLCHDVIAAGRNSAHYPISALALGEHVVRTAPSLLKVRDEALAAALGQVAARRQAAAIRVLIAGAVLAVTTLSMIGVLIVLQQRIVSPVLALTEVIGQIARLEHDVVIPVRGRTDEIGRMAVALDALHRDALAGEANKARIAHMARHDSLTGLPNRLALREALEQAVAMAARGQASAALCLDLDRFKAVNDTFGHPVGDRLLQAVTERLLACVRDVDTVSRLGGDEFVVLLMGLDMPEQSAGVARRIARALSDPFEIDGHHVGIGSSIGIAITPQDATSATALLKCADTALYRAKVEEKGSWRFFRPEMDRHLQERTALERDLRDAVKNQAFELAYQPQFHLATGRLCGFEALLRWRHHVRGVAGPGEFIPPSAFIPLAEATGLIVPLGAWVLLHACCEAMHWPAEVKLAVNLSAVQFNTKDLVQTVRQALAESGLPASRLELEITEIVLFNNSVATLAMLHELQNLGISIAIDDFGTGYSSLTCLRSFPFDRIKIEQPCIRNLPDHAASRATVRAVVALGNSLGMTTTAEGVETAEQLAELRRDGCCDAQGFFLSRPMSAAEARRFVATKVGEGIGVA